MSVFAVVRINVLGVCCRNGQTWMDPAFGGNDKGKTRRGKKLVYVGGKKFPSASLRDRTSTALSNRAPVPERSRRE